MKTIGKLKLSQLSKTELSKREQNRLLGGSGCCLCACQYASQGYSTSDNGSTNSNGGTSGLYSPGGGAQFGSSR